MRFEIGCGRQAGDWGLEVLQLIGEKVDKFSVNNGSSEREVRETDPARSALAVDSVIIVDCVCDHKCV